MFKKLGALILTGALCAALILPALAAEMTLQLGNNGEKVILSNVVSTEKKMVPFWENLFTDEDTQIKKELTIHYIAPDCVATFVSCGLQSYMLYSMYNGAYVPDIGGLCDEKIGPFGDDFEHLISMEASDCDSKVVFCMLAPPTAYAAPQTVLVDGKEVKFTAYALKDAAGNMTNYFKVRDVASVLNGTAAQFAVTWDGAVNLKAKTAYTADGSEMTVPFAGNQPYKQIAGDTLVSGAAQKLAAITLTDAKGNGYTYYKLRDLGEHLGFKVDWNGKNVTIATAP